MRLEDGVWIAASTFEVTSGDVIRYSGAMEMNDFYSKSLDKTFESILFVSEAGLVSGEKAVEPAMAMEEHGNMGMMSKNLSQHRHRRPVRSSAWMVAST